MRGAFLGGLVVAAVLLAPPVAQAVTPVQCSNLQTEMDSATPGEVLQLGPGPCSANVTVSNPNAFTLEGATSGGQTVLEPSNASLPIIQSNQDVRFTLSHLELTGMVGASALSLTGTGEGVTVTHDLLTNDTGAAAISVDVSGSDNQPTVIEDSTFSHDSGGEGGGIDWNSDQPLVVRHNTFTADSATDGADGGGGLLIWNTTSTTAGNAVQIIDNVFGGPSVADGDTSESSGGGAFISLQPQQSLTLTGNTFENDRITGTASDPNWRVGGGLFLDAAEGQKPFAVIQSHNLFKGNVIDEPAPDTTGGVIGGAGEWIIGLKVRSTADSFIGNRIEVNNGAVPEGGGVGAIAAAPINSSPALPAAFTASDDLFQGNFTASNGWGGAIYVGIPDLPCTSSCPGSGLTLSDSTVVNNHVAAGPQSEGAAIWGSPNDTLKVTNSIIYANTPNPEIQGFSSTTPAFNHSDVCKEAGGTTISGRGLICANPELTATGTETRRSPTIDRGANARVPAGLRTDLADHRRILASRTTCAGTRGPAIVDMGAFEATFKLRPTCNARVRIGPGDLSDQNGHTNLKLGCPDGYRFCQGTVSLTTASRPHLKLGGARFKIGNGATKSVRVTLRQSQLKKLGKASSVEVEISVVDHDAQGDQATSRRKATLHLPKSG